MPVMGEFREEREAIRNAPFAKKLEYFKDYYLLKTIIILAVIGLAGTLLYNYFSRKQTALYVVLVNFSAVQESTEEMVTPFAEETIDTRKEEIIIDSSSYISSDTNEVNFIKYGYEDEQRLYTMVMNGDIDLLVTGEDVLNRYAEQDWFDDLRIVMDTDDLTSVGEDRILYWKNVPIGIRIDSTSVLFKYYAYNGKAGETIYAGFPAGGVHQKTAVEFLNNFLTQ